MENLSDQLRAERARLKLSQADLADRAGISRPQLSALENGGSASLITVQALVAALGMRLVLQRAAP